MQRWIVWIVVLSAACLGAQCKKKNKKSSVIEVWTVASVDAAQGAVVAEALALPGDIRDEKGLSRAAAGRIFGEVQEMVCNVPEAVLSVDALMKAVHVGPVEALDDGRRRVRASLSLNGEGSLATVLGCKEVRLKGLRPGYQPPTDPTPRPAPTQAAPGDGPVAPAGTPSLTVHPGSGVS